MTSIIVDHTLKQNKISNELIKVKVEINALKKMFAEKNFLYYQEAEMILWKRKYENQLQKKLDRQNILIKMYNDNISQYVLKNL